jgi:hypothetical protein
MTTKGFLLLLLTMILFPPRTAFSLPSSAVVPETKPVQMVVRRINGTALDVSVSGAKADPISFWMTEGLTGRTLAAGGNDLPIDLWILVDASALCQSNHLDQYLSGLLVSLKKQVARGSLLSVASFTNSTLEVHHNHRPLADAEAVSLKCDSHLLSSSYEKALARLLDSQVTDLPTVAWIYTSGNIQLSDAMLKRLAERNVYLNVILYNAILADELKPVVDRQNERLGGDRMQLTGFNPNAALLPERWFRVEYELPEDFAGGTLTFDLAAQMGGAEVSRQSASATKLKPRTPSFWHRYGKAILLGTLVLGVLYLVYRLVAYYRPRHCSQCKRRLRVGQPTCLFCEAGDVAYLVGRFNWRDRHKANREEVLPLVSPVIEMGTHRRSRLKLLRPLGKRRARYFRIRREERPNQRVAYRLEPEGSVLLTVNGSLQGTPRYLAAGDRIGTQGFVFTFVCRRKES